MRVCQPIFPFLSLSSLLFFSAGCGTIHSFIDDIMGLGKKDVLPTIKAIPLWQRIPKRFVFYDEAGGFIPHGFFDLVPFVNVKQRTVNFVMTNPIQAKFRYSFNLASGNLYRRHRYCSRDDMAKKYERSLYRPPYTEGFVPRLLDQTGMPQQIVVFGDKNYLRPFDKTTDQSQRVQVVGGVLKQHCKSYPCREKDWHSSIVLVAINSMDEDLQNVRDLKGLKAVVDWDHALAFIGNSDGHHYIGGKFHQAVRVKGIFKAKSALQSALGQGHLFTFKEMKSIQSGCLRLYDYLWDSAELIRKKGKKSKKLPHFARFFGDFYESYHRRMATCLKYVRYSNINHHVKRHWFFVFVDMFYKLHQLDYIYLCEKQVWIAKTKAPRTGKRADLYKKCTNKQLSIGMERGLALLGRLHRNRREHYRYLTYDEGAAGSNQKLYSWVYSSGKQLQCEDDREKDPTVFPKGVYWQDYL